MKVVNKRRQNKIVMLKDDQVGWIEEENDLKAMVNGYYQKLFKISDKWCMWSQTNNTYPGLTIDDLQKLNELIGDDKIKRAMFSMCLWKALGPNGFPSRVL